MIALERHESFIKYMQLALYRRQQQLRRAAREAEMPGCGGYCLMLQFASHSISWLKSLLLWASPLLLALGILPVGSLCF